MPNFPGFEVLYDLSSPLQRRAFVATAPNESLDDLCVLHDCEWGPETPIVYEHAGLHADVGQLVRRCGLLPQDSPSIEDPIREYLLSR